MHLQTHEASELHALVRSQLRQSGLTTDAAPSLEQWHSFLRTVHRTYGEVDQNRCATERSLAVSSRELHAVCDDLQQSSQTRLAAEPDKLRLNLAVHEATLEAAADGILIVNERREVVRCNRRFLELWSLPAELIERGDYAEMLATIVNQVADPNAFVERIRYLYEHLAEASTDLIQCLDGRLIERQSASVLLDGRAPYGRVWFFRDITQKWRHENELRQAKDLAEMACRAKSDFLANMSHELRTPLNAILGFGRVLERTTVDVLSLNQQKYLGYITQAGDHMLQLVNDLLALRSLEESKLQLEAVDLASVVREAADVVRALAEQKLIGLTLVVPDALPCVVGDRRAITQVLSNLLSNAIKFTPEGGAVFISAAETESAISLEVHDTGIGIAPEDQSRLFTYFEQLGAKHEHNMKGSGIGLALTKALVAMQGGAIEVTSVLGQGSTFAVSFKVAS